MAGDLADLERPTVLVVGEDEESVDRYGVWLSRRYEVHTAYGGADAVEILRAEPDAIDAVLLDRRAPEASIDLALVSFRDAGVDCPVSLVTEEQPAFDVVDGRFDDYLVAPVTERELVRSVGSLLRFEGREPLRRELSAKRIRRNVLQLERSEDDRERNETLARLERDIERLERRLSLHRERLERRDGGEGKGERLVRELGESPVRT